MDGRDEPRRPRAAARGVGSLVVSRQLEALGRLKGLGRSGSRRWKPRALNRRPRETLGFATPADKLAELIDGLEQADAER